MVTTITRQVQKRAGNYENLDVAKIKQQIAWATTGLNVDPLTLEFLVDTKLADKVKTTDIQQNLIIGALSLCSIKEPDWRYVAGRLFMSDYRKQVHLTKQNSNKNGYSNSKFWYENVDNKQFSFIDLTKFYTLGDMKELYEYMKPERDMDYDFAGAQMLVKRYLLPGEMPQEAFMYTAMHLMSVEQPHLRMGYAKQLYDAISLRKISLATPMLSNSRSVGGSLSSCFISAMDDSIESIFDNVKGIAKISQQGGGAGLNVSRIRAKGSMVNGNANASGGVVPWIKIVNDTAIAVDQNGKRAGAVTISLDSWHLDIEEFLELQTEAGDQRRKAHDIFPQMVVSDLFMRRVENNQDWTLVCPYEFEKNYEVSLCELWGQNFENAYLEMESSDTYVGARKKINALALFKKIMKVQIETGLPYIFFKDTVNKMNPNKHAGYIPAANLCVESYSNVSPDRETHCCNLVSLNLAELTENYQAIEKYTRLAIRALDNAIKITKPPIWEAQNHNDKYRTVGLGTMGLADWLAYHNLKYGKSSIKVINELYSTIAYAAMRESIDLAAERGSYGAYEGSEWSKGLLLGGRSIEDLKEKAPALDWQSLAEDLMKYGIRNSHLLAIAPNTSSSLIQGCTASILPTYSKFFYDTWGGGNVPIMPKYIKEKMWHYQENKNTVQTDVIDTVSAIQFWIDTGISMELMFNLNPNVYGENKTLTAKDIFDTLLYAWKKECKTIYYIRSVQKDTTTAKSECPVCAN